MKVAVPSKGETLDSPVDDRFGRCSFLILVDSESMSFEAIKNPGLKESDAAGVQTSQVLIGRGVDASVVINIGHNALVTLSGAGIDVYVGGAGTIRDAIVKLRKGELPSVERPTVGFQEGLDEDK